MKNFEAHLDHQTNEPERLLIMKAKNVTVISLNTCFS